MAQSQVDVGIAWISALATLILVPSDIYHAMQASCLICNCLILIS